LPRLATPQGALLGRPGGLNGVVYVQLTKAALDAWFPERPAPVSLGFEVDGAPWQGGRRIASTVTRWAAVGGMVGFGACMGA
jgi:hypothetical protein